MHLAKLHAKFHRHMVWLYHSNLCSINYEAYFLYFSFFTKYVLQKKFQGLIYSMHLWIYVQNLHNKIQHYKVADLRQHILYIHSS